MTIDYSAVLYDPVYSVLGVPANLTTTGGIFQITVIDDTRPNTNVSGQLIVSGVAPGAFARMPELISKGIALSDCEVLAFNGTTWTIRNTELRGSRNGENEGEVRFSLKAAA